MIKHVHIKDASTFSTLKFAIDSTNTNYYLGNDTSTIHMDTTPDISYESIAICPATKTIYTHGSFISMDTDDSKKYIPQVSDLSSYSAEDNEIVQYIGTTTSNYINGYFYKFSKSITIGSESTPVNYITLPDYTNSYITISAGNYYDIGIVDTSKKYTFILSNDDSTSDDDEILITNYEALTEDYLEAYRSSEGKTVYTPSNYNSYVVIDTFAYTTSNEVECYTVDDIVTAKGTTTSAITLGTDNWSQLDVQPTITANTSTLTTNSDGKIAAISNTIGYVPVSMVNELITAFNSLVDKVKKNVILDDTSNLTDGDILVWDEKNQIATTNHWPTDSDTKNTAGSTSNTNQKLYLIGAKEQSANPQTFSNANCYISSGNRLYSGGSECVTNTSGISKIWAGSSSSYSSLTKDSTTLYILTS